MIINFLIILPLSFYEKNKRFGLDLIKKYKDCVVWKLYELCLRGWLRDGAMLSAINKEDFSLLNKQYPYRACGPRP